MALKLNMSLIVVIFSLQHIPSSKTIVDVWKLICKRNVTDELEVEALKLLHLYQKVKSLLSAFDFIVLSEIIKLDCLI